MFRKISENILSAVSPFSSAPTTPLDSPPTPDLGSLHISPSADPNTHRARAQAERTLAAQLEAYGVPMSKEDCFGCHLEDECDPADGAGDLTHVQYPRGFDVDWETDLLASSKPQPRQLVISTGKSDWPHDHTEDESTLSHHLNHALLVAAGITPAPPLKPEEKKDVTTAAPAPPAPPPPAHDPSKQPGQVDIVLGKNGLPQGIYESPVVPITTAPPSESTIPPQPGTMLFSSSLISQSTEGNLETVLALPDWKVVVDVSNDAAGASGVLRDLVMRTEEQDTGSRRTWTLPYRAVVLLCSHKRRDKRCHIAAPLLEKALIHSLEQHHVTIDTQGHSLSPDHLEETGRPLNEVPLASLDAETDRRLRAIEAVDDDSGNGKVGIFRISHLGGHRYAGVMIICFPSGATLYYGRVSPQEIPAVVKETILGGKILSGLLRSAGNAIRPDLLPQGDAAGEETPAEAGCPRRKGKTLLSW